MQAIEIQKMSASKIGDDDTNEPNCTDFTIVLLNLEVF